MTYLKKKIPWLKIALVVTIIVFSIILASVLFPFIGALIVGGILGFFAGVYAFFFVSPTWISVVVAVGLTAGVLVLITQRRYFFKQKVSDYKGAAANPVLQGGLINTNPVGGVPVPQQLIQDKDTEVISD